MGATERNETARAAWRDLAAFLPAERLIFVDEWGAHIALTPLYARAPRGQRASGSVPCNRGKNTTLIAGRSLEGMQAPLVLEGAVDTLPGSGLRRAGAGPKPDARPGGRPG